MLHCACLCVSFCQVTDMINGKNQNVYRLPPPTPCPVSNSGELINLRIPPTDKPTVTKVLNIVQYVQLLTSVFYLFSRTRIKMMIEN